MKKYEVKYQILCFFILICEVLLIKNTLYIITMLLLIFLFINADTTDDKIKMDEIKDVQNSQNQIQTKSENAVNIFYDSITSATKNQNILELNEKVPEIKKILKEKKDIDKYYIDLFKDSSSDFFYDINNQKKSTMIIFNDNYDSTIPSTFENYDKNLISDQKNAYKSESFIPDNINDFTKYTPNFIYDSNKIILPSSKTLKSVLGEEIYLTAYKQFKSNNIKNAVQLYQKLIYYNYRAAESFYYLSWCYFIQRDYIMAINYMKEAINYGEKTEIPINILAGYAYQIGNIYQDMEDYQNSIIYFNDSINKDPSLINNYNKLGISYYKIGAFEKSLEVWKFGMEKGDKNCTGNYNWLKNKLYK